MSVDNVVLLHANPGSGRTSQRVEPFVPMVLLDCEGKRAALAERFRSTTRGLVEGINRIDAELAAAAEAWRTLHAERRSADFEGFKPKFAPWLYWLLVGLAALLEVPLNESALAVLRMGEWETFGTALFIACLNTLGASLLGARLRQAGWSRAFAREWVVLAALGAAIVFAMAGLADLRVAIIAYERGPEAARQGVLGFVAMQVLFFAVATCMSYFQHHHDPKIDQVARDEHACRRNVLRLMRQRAALAEKWNRTLGVTEERLRQTEAKSLRAIAEQRYEHARVARTPAPSFFHNSVGFSAFRPVRLGRPVDPHPCRLDQVLEQEIHAK